MNDITTNDLTKELLLSFSQIFSQNCINEVAFVTKFKRRVSKFSPSLLCYAIISELSQNKEFNLSTIHKRYEANNVTESCGVNHSIAYEVFLDHLEKPSLETFIDSLRNKVTKLTSNTQMARMHDICSLVLDRLGVDRILLHDGSIINEPGQLKCGHKGIKPDQLKIHGTHDLHTGNASVTITNANTSERDYIPILENPNSLIMADNGYISSKIYREIKEANSYFIMKGRCNCNYKVLDAIAIIDNVPYSKEIKPNMTVQDLSGNSTYDAIVEVIDKDTGNTIKIRVVKYYNPKDKKHVLFYTNITSDQFTAEQIATMYRLRWQCEINYRILKGFCGLLKTKSTYQHVRRSMINMSLIVMMLKEYIGKLAEKRLGLIASPKKIASYTSSMMQEIFGLFSTINFRKIYQALFYSNKIRNRYQAFYQKIVSSYNSVIKYMKPTKPGAINRELGKDIEILYQGLISEPKESVLNDALLRL